MINRKLDLIAAVVFGFLIAAPEAVCQPQVMGWGNITGIRVDGHIHKFETSLCVVERGWSNLVCTRKEGQKSLFLRDGKRQTVKIPQLTARPDWTISASMAVEETERGAASLEAEAVSQKEADIAGVYLRLELPASLYSSGKAEFINPEPSAPSVVLLKPAASRQEENLPAVARGVRFVAEGNRLEIRFDEPSEIVIRRNGSLQIFMAILTGKAAVGGTAKRKFTLKVDGEIDRNPVLIALDANSPGQAFDGLGGNFRIQNPATDPAVVQYNLENLRVAWGRVEMPWSAWHPAESENPLEAAGAGKLDARVQEAMDMARQLARRGIPVIVSAWFPPPWAVLGKPNFRPGPDGQWGNPLNPEKKDRILESIAGYLLFLKRAYGVEAALFSFNESDLGINIRQTGEEHAELIKALGARFAAKGLATRMLLGDTSDARPIQFIERAMRDPEAVKYIGAVSFHSWRGCTEELLAQWRDAAGKLSAPLLVAEGSTDAEAWNYPQIFMEQSFALDEIELYLRILSISRPKSILQWQLTADYSILAGGGVFGDKSPLRPTQRFWNLKQLTATPAGAFALPVRCDSPGISCAAFGDIARGIYAIHIVNNGAARTAAITGLPADLKSFRAWVSDSGRGMQQGASIPVSEREAQLDLDAASFTTLIGGGIDGGTPDATYFSQGTPASSPAATPR